MEASWRSHQATSIKEEASFEMHGGDIMEKAWEGIKEEAPWRRHQGGTSLEKHPGGCIIEEAS